MRPASDGASHSMRPTGSAPDSQQLADRPWPSPSEAAPRHLASHTSHPKLSTPCALPRWEDFSAPAAENRCTSGLGTLSRSMCGKAFPNPWTNRSSPGPPCSLLIPGCRPLLPGPPPRPPPIAWAPAHRLGPRPSARRRPAHPAPSPGRVSEAQAHPAPSQAWPLGLAVTRHLGRAVTPAPQSRPSSGPHSPVQAHDQPTGIPQSRKDVQSSRSAPAYRWVRQQCRRACPRRGRTAAMGEGRK
jgi:hypothetical protein